MVQPASKRLVTEASVTKIAAPRAGSGRVVFLGDSITNGDNQNTAYRENNNAYPTFAMLASQGRWLFLENKGVGGNTTAMMLARFQADVIDLGAEVVVIMGGMNDAGFNTALTTYAANMTAMADMAEAAKIRPVFCAVTASISGGTRQNFIVAYNEWLRRFCGRRGYLFIDTYALTAQTDGALKAAWNTPGDDVHPNTAGKKAIGEYVAGKLAQLFPGEIQGLLTSTVAPQDLLASTGLFLTAQSGGANNGVGTGWSANGGANPGATSFSLVTDSNVVGNMQHIKASSTPGTRISISRTAAAGSWSPGDRIAVSGIVTTDGTGRTAVQLLFTSAPAGKTSYYVLNTDQAITRGRLYWEFDIPTGTTQVTVLAGALNVDLAGMDIGQFSIKNLTKGGYLA